MFCIGDQSVFTARKRSLRRLRFYTCQNRGGGLGPDPGGRFGGLAREGCPGPHPGGCTGPGECIPACTEVDTPQQTATAADGTHPTGMHSCFLM